MPPVITSLEPGIAVSAAATRPPVHDSAVASVQPSARQRSSTISSTPRPSLEYRNRPSRSESASSSSTSRCSALGSATRSTWISKLRAQIVTSSPSPSPPASWNACATCDSPGPKKRSVFRSGAVPRSSTRRTSGASSARGQSRCSSVGGPGSTITGVPFASTTRPGAVPARPRIVDGSGTVACFVTPSEKSAYGRFIRSATIRETPSICASSSASTRTARPCDLRHDPDRAVVVRRPEPARRRDQVGRRDGLGHGSLQLGRVVADDVDPGRLDPEREQRPRQERPVQVGALAAHELAAGDDDDRAWPRAVRARQAASAAKIFFAVTKTPCALTAAGSRTRLPLRRTSTFCGDSSRTQSTWPSNRCFWPRSSVPW